MTREGGVADTVKILIYSLITMQNLSNPHSNWLLLITVTTANVVVLSQCFIQIPKRERERILFATELQAYQKGYKPI